jgi:hypothetical protein
MVWKLTQAAEAPRLKWIGLYRANSATGGDRMTEGQDHATDSTRSGAPKEPGRNEGYRWLGIVLLIFGSIAGWTTSTTLKSAKSLGEQIGAASVPLVLWGFGLFFFFKGKGKVF